MTHIYSDPSRENDTYSLPDVEVFQLTAAEVAEQDEDMVREYLRRFPLATMNSRDRDRMIDAMVEENGITGGWFYWFCFPGCMPEGSAMGPYPTRQAAEQAARDEVSE